MTPDRQRYDRLRKTRAELFENPPGAIFTILVDPREVDMAECDAAARLRAAGRPEAWAKTGVVYEDPYLLRLRDAVRFPDGTLGTYVRDINPHPATGVVVLPVFKGDVVLINHFRHATRQWHLELPRGFGEAGVSPIVSAQRELSEEIGATAIAIEPLGELHADTGTFGEAVALFFAEVDQVGAPETAEAIDAIRVVPPSSMRKMIHSGAITDGYTLAAYLRATLSHLLSER